MVPPPGVCSLDSDCMRQLTVTAALAVFLCAGCTEATLAPADDATTTTAIPTITTSITMATAATTRASAATTTTIPPTTATTVPECSLSESIPRVLRSVIQVVTDEGTGTAFYIGDGWFATAAHVVVDTGEVTLHGDRDVVVEVAAYDTSIDLAFLYTPEVALMPQVSWADMSTLEPGVELAVIGYPTGVTGVASATDGRLSRLTEYPGQITFLQTNAESNPGNSGGPVITECGDVAGLVVSKLVDVDVEGISFAVGADTVATFLTDEQVGEEFLWDTYGGILELCDYTETRWLREVVFELDQILKIDEDFTDAWDIAVEEQWALVENDPTWRQAIIALTFRYEQPALSIVDLLPAPSPTLGESDHLLLGFASAVADFGQAMPRAVRLYDHEARDRAIDDLYASFDLLTSWLENVTSHCSGD